MGFMYREAVTKQGLVPDLIPKVEFVHLPPERPWGLVSGATDMERRQLLALL